MKIDVNLPKELKSLSSIQPGTVFVHDGDVYEKSAETDPDGDIVVMKLSDGTIHRYPECMISEIDVTLVENKKDVNVPIFGGHSINLCSTEHTTSHS